MIQTTCYEIKILVFGVFFAEINKYKTKTTKGEDIKLFNLVQIKFYFI